MEERIRKVEEKQADLDKRLSNVEVSSELKDISYNEFKSRVELFMESCHILFVSAIEFKPIRMLVYGGLSALLLAFLAALIGLVIK